MEIIIKEIGEKIKEMAKEFLKVIKEIFMKEIGLMIKEMVKELKFIQMEINITY